MHSDTCFHGQTFTSETAGATSPLTTTCSPVRGANHHRPETDRPHTKTAKYSERAGCETIIDNTLRPARKSQIVL
jgi:hypothetical protein